MKKLLFFLPLLFLFACNGDDPMDVDNTKTPIDITLSDWRVLQVKNGDNVNDPAASYILKLDSDGMYSLRLDVNTCTGTYEVDLENKRISFDGGCTEACCDSDPALDIAEVLGKVVRYELASAPGDTPLIFWAEPNYINFTQN
ncbi:MAG: META domain-containing protein [Saprospiraceae bacterium]